MPERIPSAIIGDILNCIDRIGATQMVSRLMDFQKTL